MNAESVKAQALQIGFDLCGICLAEAFPELGLFRDWVDRGYSAVLPGLARSAARRADVREILPTAKSVIVTGTVYNVDRPYSIDSQEPSRASIARYAWGDDYHRVIGQRLQQLLSWMRSESGEPIDALTSVDAGPVQERAYARRAGLGWIGKNTCLINAEQGSWLFLGEIVCSIPLEPDAAVENRCGSCTACLKACPTGALVEAGVLDPARCLAYLTLECRHGIPESQRDGIANHVYGCDICQEVCPWNRPAAKSRQPEWQPKPDFDQPKLVDLWQHSDSELARAIEGSPMSRAGVTRLRRNVAVALGNSEDPEALSVLSAEPREESVRGSRMLQDHIAWATRKLAR